MSALRPKADMDQHGRDVCLVSFLDVCPGGDLCVKTAETLPAFLNFNRSSGLLRRSLVIQSRGRKLQHGSSLAGN